MRAGDRRGLCRAVAHRTIAILEGGDVHTDRTRLLQVIEVVIYTVVTPSRLWSIRATLMTGFACD